MATTERACLCGAAVTSPSAGSFADTFLGHVRSEHPDWPYPDGSVRNVGEALVRLRAPREPRTQLGPVEVVPLDPDRLEAWLGYFEVEAFAGDPVQASCFCLEPFLLMDDEPWTWPWQQRRDAMVERIRDGRAQGYLAEVDGEVVGWVNASWLADQVLYRKERAAVADDDAARTIAITCFVVRPDCRSLGVAARLLDRVVADAPARGAVAIEAYPFRSGPRGERTPDSAGFRGPWPMYADRGFERIEVRRRDSVMRLPIA